MRAGWNDSRMLLLVMAADGIEATGRSLQRIWQHASRAGRLDRALRRLLRKGQVDPTGSEEVDARLFRITLAGRQALLGDIEPEALWSRKWDGKWRLALFDVPQTHVALRTRLRRKLRELRFGWLQNSVWVSPDPVDVLTRLFEQEKGSVENLAFLEARPAGLVTDQELVAGAWDFERLARLQEVYLKVLRLRPARGRRAEVSAWLAWAETEQRAWLEVKRHDPFLPEVLWPEGYAGRRIWSERLKALHEAGGALARLAAES